MITLAEVLADGGTDPNMPVSLAVRCQCGRVAPRVLPIRSQPIGNTERCECGLVSGLGHAPNGDVVLLLVCAQ